MLPTLFPQLLPADHYRLLHDGLADCAEVLGHSNNGCTSFFFSNKYNKNCCRKTIFTGNKVVFRTVTLQCKHAEHRVGLANGKTTICGGGQFEIVKGEMPIVQNDKQKTGAKRWKIKECYQVKHVGTYGRFAWIRGAVLNQNGVNHFFQGNNVPVWMAVLISTM